MCPPPSNPFPASLGRGWVPPGPWETRSQDPPLSTVRCVILTVDAIEACRAGARVAVHTIGAVGTVSAGITGTFIDVLLTEGTLEARQAVAEGHVDAVGAGTPIVTRV